MRVPRALFKNADGPYFRVGKSDTFRPYYERELQDKHGLYEGIEAYLGCPARCAAACAIARQSG